MEVISVLIDPILVQQSTQVMTETLATALATAAIWWWICCCPKCQILTLAPVTESGARNDATPVASTQPLTATPCHLFP